jgi:hypothetical protein
MVYYERGKKDCNFVVDWSWFVANWLGCLAFYSITQTQCRIKSADKIREELENKFDVFPGQIKITIIREYRAEATAKI